MDELRKPNPEPIAVDALATSVYSYDFDVQEWINILDALVEKIGFIQPAESEALFWKFLHGELKDVHDATLALEQHRGSSLPQQSPNFSPKSG